MTWGRRGRGAAHDAGGDEGADAAQPLLGGEHRIDIERGAAQEGETPGQRGGGPAERDPPSDVGSPPAPHSTVWLLRRASTQPPEAATPPAEHAFTLAIKEPEGGHEDEERDNVREIEVEVLTEAVAEAVADAVNEVVQEAVQEAVHDAVVQAIEENASFDVRANLYTLIAVTGVVLYWRGVWNTWDYFFGLSLWSEVSCIVAGLSIMLIIRYTRVPLAEGLPGG